MLTETKVNSERLITKSATPVVVFAYNTALFSSLVLGSNLGIGSWIAGKVADKVEKEIEARRTNTVTARHKGGTVTGKRMESAAAAHKASHELLLQHGIMTPAMKKKMEERIREEKDDS